MPRQRPSGARCWMERSWKGGEEFGHRRCIPSLRPPAGVGARRSGQHSRRIRRRRRQDRDGAAPLHGEEHVPVGFEVRHPLGTKAESGERRGREVGRRRNPEHRPACPGEDAGDRQRHGWHRHRRRGPRAWRRARCLHRAARHRTRGCRVESARAQGRAMPLNAVHLARRSSSGIARPDCPIANPPQESKKRT